MLVLSSRRDVRSSNRGNAVLSIPNTSSNREPLSLGPRNVLHNRPSGPSMAGGPRDGPDVEVIAFLCPC